MRLVYLFISLLKPPKLVDLYTANRAHKPITKAILAAGTTKHVPQTVRFGKN